MIIAEVSGLPLKLTVLFSAAVFYFSAILFRVQMQRTQALRNKAGGLGALG